MAKLDKINFIPVLNGSVLNCALRDDLFFNNKRATFYTKDGIFNYNKFLINPFHHDELYKRIKDKGLLIHDSLCMADSGGLQEVTLKEKRHTPEEVFQWQQENTDIGFSVDVLPFITPKYEKTKPGAFGGWIFDHKNYKKCAEASKQNIEVTKKYRDKNKKFKFYGIIQGRGYNEYLEWYEIIRDDAYLDGYCCKAPNVNPITLAETCIFVMQNIAKPVHFLGIGNISRSIVLYYANKYIKQPISFDSSSYDIGTQYRWYLLPFMISKKIRFVSPSNLTDDKKDDVHSIVDVVHPNDLSEICDCIVCRTIGSKAKDMTQQNHPALGGMLSVHNLIQNIRWLNYVKLIMEKGSRQKINEFVNYNFEKNLAGKILTAFNMIDMAHEKGSEYTFNRYKNVMQGKHDTKKQTTIFSHG